MTTRDNKGRFVKGGSRPKEWTTSQTEKVSGERNYAWKGAAVGYRGLHQWLMRRLGKPTVCSKCGKVDIRPRFIQWANIDGKYRRLICDYIALCVSCHKLHDIAIAKEDAH